MVEYLEVGEPVKGEEIYIPKEALTESVPGAYYRIKIRTKPITRISFDAVAKTIQTELPKKVEGLKVRYVKVEWNRITIDVEGSPFAWQLVLFWLPEILTIIGITVTAIGVFLIYMTVPGWMTAMVIAGALLTLIGLAPRIISMMGATTRMMGEMM